MDWTLVIELLIPIGTLVILLSASVSDHLTREISDTHWYLLGFLGILGGSALHVIDYGICWQVLAGLVLSSVFLLSILGNDEKLDLALCAISLILALLFFGFYDQDEGGFSLMISVVIGGLFLAGYWFGIIRGGADTKCLICLGFVLSSGIVECDIPYVRGLMAVCFHPAVSVLFVASLISVVGCVTVCLFRNLRSGNDLCIRGYRLELALARKSHVWPMEDVVDGKVTRCSVPDDDEVCMIYDRLGENGADDVLVTPMVPFIIPITVSFVLVFATGGPFTLLC